MRFDFFLLIFFQKVINKGLPSLMPGTMFWAFTRWMANFAASYT